VDESQLVESVKLGIFVKNSLQRALNGEMTVAFQFPVHFDLVLHALALRLCRTRRLVAWDSPWQLDEVSWTF